MRFTPLLPQEKTLQQKLTHYVRLKDEARALWKDMIKTYERLAIKSHAFYDDYTKTALERNHMVSDLQANWSLVKRVLNHPRSP